MTSLPATAIKQSNKWSNGSAVSGGFAFDLRGRGQFRGTWYKSFGTLVMSYTLMGYFRVSMSCMEVL
jgi:hypothetical protein